MRFLLILAAFFGLSWTISRLRRRQISVLVAGFWAALWFAIGIVALAPELTNRLADFLNIGRGADVVLYTAIVVVFVLLFKIFVRLEQLDRAITKVTRELALRDATEKRDKMPS